ARRAPKSLVLARPLHPVADGQADVRVDRSPRLLHEGAHVASAHVELNGDATLQPLSAHLRGPGRDLDARELPQREDDTLLVPDGERGDGGGVLSRALGEAYPDRDPHASLEHLPDV